MTKPERPARVAVFSKPHPQARAVLGRIRTLLEDQGIEMVPDNATAKALGLGEASRRAEIVEEAGLVLSVGGDGTLLAAARAIGGRGIPILGVNLGGLGFLTETRCEEVEDVLEAYFAGLAPIAERWPLTVRKAGLPEDGRQVALNDVVFSKRNLARLFVLSVFSEGERIADYRADGLIVASPTGSTAYSLAAGGPLVLPEVDAIVVTPICPHSLSQRPMILAGSQRLEVRLGDEQPPRGVQVTLDGQVGYPLEPDDVVSIARTKKPVRLIRPPGRSYFGVLRDKLGWGQM